jgi:hypothetical protein
MGRSFTKANKNIERTIMRSVFAIFALAMAISVSVSAQEKMEEKHAGPTEADKTAAIPADGYLKRGEPIGKAEKVSLAEVLQNPTKFAGKTVRVEGVIVRSCKMEGCWAELAPAANGKSVRVNMKKHGFFIPLQSAGASARVEGVVSVKTLSKEHVDHLINEDGAKFDNRNPDGTVSEISFEATGIELRKATK